MRRAGVAHAPVHARANRLGQEFNCESTANKTMQVGGTDDMKCSRRVRWSSASAQRAPGRGRAAYGCPRSHTTGCQSASSRCTRPRTCPQSQAAMTMWAFKKRRQGAREARQCQWAVAGFPPFTAIGLITAGGTGRSQLDDSNRDPGMPPGMGSFSLLVPRAVEPINIAVSRALKSILRGGGRTWS